MDKKNKGLADNQDGEFILNESGTSVSTDQVEGVDVPEPESLDSDKTASKETQSSSGPEEKDITD